MACASGSQRLRSVLLAALVGFAVGCLTQIGQSVLPDGVGQVANAISPWLAVAFAVGALMPFPRWAVVAGLIALICALVGYYVMVELRFGYSTSPGRFLYWAVGALVGGTLFGAAGWHWRRGTRRAHVVAISLVGAAFVADGAYLILLLPETTVGAAFMIVGMVSPLLLGRTNADRAYGLVGILPWLLLGALGYAAFIVLDGFVAGV